MPRPGGMKRTLPMLSQAPVRLRHDTAGERPQRQFGFWNDAVCQTFTPLDCSRREPLAVPFLGCLETVALGDLRVSRVRSEGLRVQRRREHIARSVEDRLQAVVLHHGRVRCTQAGGETEAAPGELLLIDTGRPFELHFPASYDILVMQVPQRLARDYFRDPHALANTRLSCHGVAGLLAGFLHSLWALDDPDMACAGSAQIGQVALGLLEAAVRAARQAQQPADRRCARLRAIKRLIERDLRDPRLSPAAIARALGFSTRYLHRVFASEGVSVAQYIRARRLEEAARELRDPRRMGNTVTDVALQCGFVDASHFGRVFKRCYGVSPQQYRAGADAGR